MNSRRHLIVFKDRFASLVEAGAKKQTVRPVRQRMPRHGDTLSLRAWTGIARRSKQRVLLEVELIAVEAVEIGTGALAVGGRDLGPEERDAFARSDGFADFAELEAWFLTTHKELPFCGVAFFW